MYGGYATCMLKFDGSSPRDQVFHIVYQTYLGDDDISEIDGAVPMLEQWDFFGDYKEALKMYGRYVEDMLFRAALDPL